ncbi:MAG: hypothetical protein OXH75_02700 [Acidobacteria bacterium]|nr:hypothetical protein [Acidobacteriota bacterium]
MSEATLLLSVVGTGIAVTAVVVSVVALVANGINSRLSEVREDVDKLRRELREDHATLDARLRGVEIGFAKIDQRLATVERAILPQAPPDA